jgi:hypothetical protein
MKLPFKLQLKKRTKYKEADTFIRVRLSIMGFVAIMLLILVVFIYRDFYRTIVQANEVIVLKQEVALQNIDIIKFNALFATHQYKRTNILPEEIYDPFNTDKIEIENLIDENVDEEITNN